MTNPVISPDGKKRWYDENGLRHRVDGPAIEWSNGDKWWMRHGNFHRVDGPAIEHSTMMRTFLDEEWYVNGEPIDIKPILERLDVSPDWRNWTDEEKFLVRLACAPMISDTESKRITNL